MKVIPPPMFRFTIRDLFWLLLLVAALCLAYREHRSAEFAWAEHARMAFVGVKESQAFREHVAAQYKKIDKLQEAVMEEQRMLREKYGYRPDGVTSK